MKHRITYLRDHLDSAFDPAKHLQVASESFSIQAARGGKEHRITVGLNELPDDLALFLKQYHELHLKWQSPSLSAPKSPLHSRLSPGVHILLSPLQDASQRSGAVDTSHFCRALLSWISPSAKCSLSNAGPANRKSSNETLASPLTSAPILSRRFSAAASHHYYHPLVSLEHLASHIQDVVCAAATDEYCKKLAASLITASSLDADYDTISRALTLTAYFDDRADAKGWTEVLHRIPGSRQEIGVLNHERATEREELSLGGWLTVVGEDAEPSTTLFSFPSRHHPAPLQYEVSFDKPTGLHPTLRITLHSSVSTLVRPQPSCSLHTYLTMPSTFFIDKYVFADALFLQSHNIASLRSISGETDLEAPEWAVSKWGSAALFEIDTSFIPTSPANAVHQQAVSQYDFTIPMHLRYLDPAPGGYSNISFPWPVVFWACKADEGTKMSNNPFDRTNLGYDGLFGDRTMFYHASPRLRDGRAAIETVTVPVLDPQRSAIVQWGTAVAITLGFLWICWCAVKPVAAQQAVSKKGGEGQRNKKVQ